jgi:uncharacterized protein (DUF1015 family)
MVAIRPFRGIRYNPQRVEDMQAVVSQPYDRINVELQQRYYDLSPYNIVRIIQGKAELDGPDVYARARQYYRQWLDERILIQEDQPVLYAYEQTFTAGGRQHNRLGLIAAVQLVDLDEGIILPHEKTHSGPKEDRLRLLTALQANTEQIFLLYPDSENKVNHLIHQAIAGRQPDIDAVEIYESDVRQRVWVIRDPAILQAIQAEMATKRNLIIADGHHRYETGLNYRRAQRQAHPGAPLNAAFNFIAATLVSTEDPGLVILPTHREIFNFGKTSPAAILERSRQYFDVTPAASLDTCLAAVTAHPTGHAFGFYGGPQDGFSVLALKDDALAYQLIPDDRSSDWKSLAVSILHRVLLEQIAGVPAQGVEDQSMIRYHRDARESVVNVDRGAGDFAFFLSATHMSQIRACAAHGEKMPQKSTDFYPKVISGLTLLSVGADERL